MKKPYMCTNIGSSGSKAFIQALLSAALCAQRFSFLTVFFSSVAPWGSPMVDTKGKMFEIYLCRLLKNAFFLDFSQNFIKISIGE